MAGKTLGEWSDFNFTLSRHSLHIFEEALKGLAGVQYTPVAFATQVVKGTNYCFLCKARMVYPEAPDYAATVYIYAPPQGDPSLHEIVHVKPNGNC